MQKRKLFEFQILLKVIDVFSYFIKQQGLGESHLNVLFIKPLTDKVLYFPFPFNQISEFNINAIEISQRNKINLYCIDRVES